MRVRRATLKAPERGDVGYVHFDPSTVTEMAYHHPALMISPTAFNEHFGLALVAPIPSKPKGHGFEVVLDGTGKVCGAVLCHQIKMIDYQAREFEWKERVSQAVMSKVLEIIGTITK